MIYRQRFRVGMDKVDAQGIVYFARYWEWYEECFEGLIEEASGKPWGELVASGIGFPYVHCEIDFRAPVRLSDVVDVEIAPVRVGTRSVHFSGRFRNAEGLLVATAGSIHTAVDRRLEKPPIPAWLAEAVEVSEGVDAKG